MPGQDIYGAAPGVGPTLTATHRQILLGNERFFPGNHIIQGADARDPLNTPVTEIRAGLLLGEVTADNVLGASIIGISGEAMDGEETAMTVGAAVATELIRREGASGTYNLTGPPTAAGVVRTILITYSAVSATVITQTAPEVASVHTLTHAAGTDTGLFSIKVILPDGTHDTTSGLAWDATAATINTALDALSVLSAGQLVATGSAGGPYTLTGNGDLGDIDIQIRNDGTLDATVWEGGVVVAQTAIGVDGRFVTGSLIQPTDGSQTIKTFIPDGYPVKVVDTLLADRDVQLDRYPIGGVIDSSQLINWPADASLRTWVVDALNLVGNFEFDHLHGA